MKRSLARRVQARLDALYGLETPDVTSFVRPSAGGREVLEVRESRRRGVEVALYLPEEAVGATPSATSLDVLCQVIEGVSHFVYLAERTRRNLPTTHLELELQAEVDKFVIVAESVETKRPDGALAPHASSALRERLFGGVTFLHPEGSEPGERYRLANRLAARFVRTLDGQLGRKAEERAARTLRRFFDSGQREKIEMALAA